MKSFFSHTLEDAIHIWATLSLEILSTSLIYLALRLIGISNFMSSMICVIFAIMLVLLVPFILKHIEMDIRLVKKVYYKSLVLKKGQTHLLKNHSRAGIFLKHIQVVEKKYLLRYSFLIVIIFVVGSLMTISGVIQFVSEQASIINGITATGHVITVDCSNEVACVPVVSFETQNNEIIQAKVRCCSVVNICVLGRCIPQFVAIGESDTNISKGQVVTVIYNPSNPSDVQIKPVNGEVSPPLQTSDLLTYGIFLMLLGLLCSAYIITLSIIIFIYSLTKLALSSKLNV